MKKGVILIIILALAAIFLPLVSATFSLGVPNSSIDTIYGPSQPITGWINISFSNEPLSSSFLATIGSQARTANLSEILKNNIGYNYSCNPVDCGNDFTAANPEVEKSVNLVANETRRLGLRFSGNVSSINSIRFEVHSSATTSCVNQLKIDLFDNGTVDYLNTESEPGDQSCGVKSYGCFNSSRETETYTLTTQYCQKINISETPSVRMGAWIKNNSGAVNLKMGLHDLGGTEKGNCNLPSVNVEGEYYCDIEHTITERQEYYVCIYPTSGTGDFRIKGNTNPQPACGFQGNDFDSSKVAAYDIFAQPRQFAAFGTQTIGNSLSNGVSFSTLAREYLVKRYGEKGGKIDCTAGCILPIALKAGIAQNVTIRNVAVSYQKDAGNVEENSVYELSTTSAKITSSFRRFYIDSAGFNVPSSIANYTFALKLNSMDVLSQKVEVKNVPIITAISPLRTATVFPTEFVAIVNASRNLSSFTWDFGDGTAKATTSNNKAIHTYNQTGVYTLVVNVTDQGMFSSVKSFTINVSSPKDLIETRLDELGDSINEIKTDVSTLDDFSSEAIFAAFSLDTVEAQLASLRTRYASATTEDQYNAIVADILKLENIPESVSKTKGADNLPFISVAEQVNLDALESIAGGTADNEGYMAAAAFWQLENLDTKVDFTEYSGRYDGKLVPIVKVFTLSANDKTDIPYDYFLIIPEPEGFYSNAAFEKKDGFAYINLREHSGDISFSTTEDTDFTDLGAFISPGVSRLSVESVTEAEEPTNKWMVFWLIIIALLIVGVLVYMILHQWYRNHYEKHLFPNRNDLYNMSTYIHTALKKGQSNENIEANLKKAGWSSERIKYAMKKYVGKKIGMPF